MFAVCNIVVSILFPGTPEVSGLNLILETTYLDNSVSLHKSDGVIPENSTFPFMLFAAYKGSVISFHLH
jgi:hypothetical protein